MSNSSLSSSLRCIRFEWILVQIWFTWSKEPLVSSELGSLYLLLSRVRNWTTCESSSIYSANLLAKIECIIDVWSFVPLNRSDHGYRLIVFKIVECIQVTVAHFWISIFRSLFEIVIPSPLLKCQTPHHPCRCATLDSKDSCPNMIYIIRGATCFIRIR